MHGIKCSYAKMALSDFPASQQLVVKKSSSSNISSIGGGPFFGLLPDELILKILLLLPLKDVALKMMHINNRRITNLCQDPDIWWLVNVRKGWDPYSACKIIFMAGERLLTLFLDCSLGVGESRMLALTALANSPRLVSLVCDQTLFTTDLMKAIGESRSLREIITKNDVIRTPGAPEKLQTTEFVSNLTSLKNLTNISITEVNLDVTANANWVMTLADICCEKLETLCLPSCIGKVLNDEVFKHLLEKLKNRIKILSVWGGPMLTDASIVHVKNCQQLQDLRLFGLTNIGRKGLGAIMDLSIRLQRLSITRMRLSRRNIADAFAGKIMKKLEYLNMYGCVGLNDYSIDEILESCSNLKGLYLVNCKKIGSRGVSSILQCCKKLSCLQL